MNLHKSTDMNQLKCNLYTFVNLEGVQLSFSERLKQRMADQDLKAKDIVLKLGVAKGTVSQWVNGIAEPRGRNATALTALLRCNSTWLFEGRGLPDRSVELELGPDLRGKVPLISWIQAGSWLEMADAEPEATIYYAHTANVGPRAFALRVVGDSMTSYTGGKSIPEGAVVIVDPDITAENGSVVVARLDDTNEATLKQYVLDGNRKQLKPFNPQHKVIDINGNCTIIGVVKQVIQDF